MLKSLSVVILIFTSIVYLNASGGQEEPLQHIPLSDFTTAELIYITPENSNIPLRDSAASKDVVYQLGNRTTTLEIDRVYRAVGYDSVSTVIAKEEWLEIIQVVLPEVFHRMTWETIRPMRSDWESFLESSGSDPSASSWLEFRSGNEYQSIQWEEFSDLNVLIANYESQQNTLIADVGAWQEFISSELEYAATPIISGWVNEKDIEYYGNR